MASSAADRMRALRQRRKEKGLKEVRILVPDSSTPEFQARLKAELEWIKTHGQAEEEAVMEMIEANTAWDLDDER